MTNEEIAESAHALIAASGSPLKAIHNLHALLRDAESPEEIRDLDELLLYTRNVREAQIEAGEIFRRVREGRRK